MKKVLVLLGVIFALLIVAAAAITAVVLISPGKVRRFVTGETTLLDYLGTQVVGIANTHLTPELGYDRIRYEPPYTLALGGVRLDAPDGTRVLELGSMTIVLAETPALNRPLRIASLSLSNGAVRLIQDPDAGGFRGLSPLVKPGEDRERRTRERPEFRLADVLVLEKIVIDGIDLVYDAGDGSEPMRLDALRADLDIVPAADAGPGWYDLRLASGRRPGLQLDLDGRINIESFDLDLRRLEARAELDDRTANTLPPQAAAAVNRYQLRGEARAALTGRVPLTAPANAEVTLDAGLTGGRAVFGEYQIPIDSLSLRAGLSSGVVDPLALEAAALQGRFTANGRVVLGTDAHLAWEVTGMDLRELLASRPADRPPKMAGAVTSTGSVRAPVADPLAGLSGAGDLAVREGRLVNVPVLSDLVSVMELTGLAQTRLTDSFSSPLIFSPEGVRLEGFDFRTAALAARGSGVVRFDGSLDLSVNGGPLESVQNKLGKLGSIFGQITDRFVTYRVRGTVSAPSVSVQPLGIGG